MSAKITVLKWKRNTSSGLKCQTYVGLQDDDDMDDDDRMDVGAASDSSSDDEHAWTADDKMKWKQHIKDQKMVIKIS